MLKVVKRTIAGIITIIVLLAGLSFAGRFIPVLNVFGTNTKSSDTQVIRALKRTEEVSLLSLGITGITSQEKNSTFFNMEIPGTDRARFIQYTFDAKLGIDGRDVVAEKSGDKQFDISIPEFKFIGYDHPKYQTVVENNGLLSFGTEQIDSAEMINNILTEKAQQEYVNSNRDLLKDQARSFYTSIITSIDPEMHLNFHFAGEDNNRADNFNKKNAVEAEAE